MKLEQYSILGLSDIHLGHALNHTDNIICNLRKFFIKYRKDIIKTKLIIISGDVFDKLLSSNGLEINLALEWLTELILFCKEQDIILRILEGTPGHDWKQVKLIFTILDKLDIDVDFRYVEEIEIEYIEKLMTTVLYVPDEAKPTTAEIYQEVQFKLKELAIDKVDIAVMHGTFDYQLPIPLPNVHIPKDYLDIVRGPIIIGHHHSRSNYKRIITPGSFDAMNHSDDNTKGGVYINYTIKDSKFRFRFLDNKEALKFKTIDVRGKDLSYIYKQLERYNNHNDLNRFNLRLHADINEPIRQNMLELTKNYTNLNITFKSSDKNDVTTAINIEVIPKRVSRLDYNTILKYIQEKNTELNDESLVHSIEKEFIDNYS